MQTHAPRGAAAEAALVDALVERLLAVDWGKAREADLSAFRRAVFQAACAWPPTPAQRHRIGNVLSPAVTHAYLLHRDDLPCAERAELRARIARAIEEAVSDSDRSGGPRAPASVPSLAPPSEAPSADAAGGRSRRALVVDDEGRVLRAVERFLRGSRLGVDCFTDPTAAIEAFTRDPSRYDLALIDWNMPTMEGPTLAASLRALRADLPIVFATGGIVEAAELRARGVAGCAVIAKPFAPSALIEVMECALGRPA